MGTPLGYNPHWHMLLVFKILLTSDRDKMESAIPAFLWWLSIHSLSIKEMKQVSKQWLEAL